MRVLIVGNKGAHPVLRDFLVREGYKNVMTLRGSEFLKGAFETPQPDLLLLDLGAFESEQEVVTGLERLQETYLPVLVLTDADSRVRNRLLAGGARDVLAKPFDSEELCLRVHHLLQARALYLEAERQKRYLEILLTLQRQIVTSPLEEAYAHILEAAVRTVPGAEAGSLLVRTGDVMCFKAVHGYTLDALEGVGFSDADMARWHGGDAEAWRRGEPRVLSRKDANIAERAFATVKPQALAHAGRLEELQANLYLPVAHRGEVLAVLNLDNMSSQEAFAEEALAAARLFCSPVAALLHEGAPAAPAREGRAHRPPNGPAQPPRLRRGARAGTRRGRPARRVFRGSRHGLSRFQEGQRRARSQPGGPGALFNSPSSRVPSARGGQVGALGAATSSPRSCPRTLAPGAAETAWRYARAIEAVDPGGVYLGVNIGLAVFPEDGSDVASLFRAADSRMYAAKKRGLTLLGNALKSLLE